MLLFGNPDEDRIITSHIERLNHTLSMSLPRFARVSNGHSKSLRHDKAMLALVVAWYSFGWKNEALKGKTPVMASGVADHVWTIEELVEQAARF
jgi:hypothetical protein